VGGSALHSLQEVLHTCARQAIIVVLRTPRAKCDAHHTIASATRMMRPPHRSRSSGGDIKSGAASPSLYGVSTRELFDARSVADDDIRVDDDIHAATSVRVPVTSTPRGGAVGIASRSPSETTPRGGNDTPPGGDCTILGGIHAQSTTLHMRRRPRRFARGARRFITRCDALGTRERDFSVATDRLIVATRRLLPSARSVARRERSSHHADRSSSHADRSCAQPGARDNRCGRSSLQCDRCRTRISSVVFAGVRFVSSRRRFM
jgi:hypothetical protein